MNFNRHIIKNDIIIHYNNEKFSKEEFCKIIDIMKCAFYNIGIKKDQTISISGKSNTDIYFLACLFAISELGAIFVSQPEKTRILIEVDYYFNNDEIYSLYKKNINNYIVFNMNHTDIMWVFTTSGTTTRPKKIYHTHSSILEANKNLKHIYWNKKAFVFTNWNHLGHACVNLLPALQYAAEIYLHNSLHYTTEDEEWNNTYCHNSDIMMLFNHNVHYLINMKLSTTFLENKTIITGGECISYKFVDFCFDNKVKEIYSIYGMTEIVAPIAIKHILTKDNYDPSFIGEFVDSVEYKLDIDNYLMLKSPSICYKINDAIINQNVFFPTGDFMKDIHHFILDRGQKITNDLTVEQFKAIFISLLKPQLQDLYLIQIINKEQQLYVFSAYFNLDLIPKLKTMKENYNIYKDIYLVFLNEIPNNELKVDFNKLRQISENLNNYEFYII